MHLSTPALQAAEKSLNLLLGFDTVLATVECTCLEDLLTKHVFDFGRCEAIDFHFSLFLVSRQII